MDVSVGGWLFGWMYEWMCIEVCGGWVGVWMDISVVFRWLGRCMDGCVDRGVCGWVDLEFMVGCVGS